MAHTIIATLADCFYLAAATTGAMENEAKDTYVSTFYGLVYKLSFTRDKTTTFMILKITLGVFWSP